MQQLSTFGSSSSSSSSLLLLFLTITLLDSAHALSYGPVFIRGGLKSYSQLELPSSVFGPESVAFDCHGKGPYVGVSDGRILKWQEADRAWTEFAVTSPRRQDFSIYIYIYIYTHAYAYARTKF